MRWAPWLRAAVGGAVMLLAILFVAAGPSRSDPPAPRLGTTLGAVERVTEHWGPGAVADGFVRRHRALSRCENPMRGIRNAPDKYLLGRCGAAPAERRGYLPPTGRRLLPESEFASLIAEDTCNTARCVSQARAAHGRWVLADGLEPVRPRTTAWCDRARNLDFATDRPAAGDRLLRRIPPGTPVRWRYASRGGGWVMAHWSPAGKYAWAFIPRACVADPPTWSTITLRGPHHRVVRTKPFEVLRPALPCPSRLRCPAAR